MARTCAGNRWSRERLLFSRTAQMRFSQQNVEVQCQGRTPLSSSQPAVGGSLVLQFGLIRFVVNGHQGAT